MLHNNSSTQRSFDALGVLLLSRPGEDDNSCLRKEIDSVSGLDQRQLRDFLRRAETQRVLRRTLHVLDARLPVSRSALTSELLHGLLRGEEKRVGVALAYLERIVDAFEGHDVPITVMKTLDHWPDTGHDLDLLVNATDEQVCRIFETEFSASPQPQSWCDRLAHKFNFCLTNLRELVEVHVGYLGQTGEQQALAAGVLSRRTWEVFGGCNLPVPTAEDRIAIATLQRMYRHYYIRLTDIVNIFGLLGSGQVDFDRLHAITQAGSIWPGTATLLSIVCQHGVRYGGKPIALPDAVVRAARFNAARTYMGRDFVRVPVVPEAAGLFLQQLAGNGRHRNFRAVGRLTLLPVLATAALVSFHLTGNDKGVW